MPSNLQPHGRGASLGPRLSKKDRLINEARIVSRFKKVPKSGRFCADKMHLLDIICHGTWENQGNWDRHRPSRLRESDGLRATRRRLPTGAFRVKFNYIFNPHRKAQRPPVCSRKDASPRGFRALAVPARHRRSDPEFPGSRWPVSWQTRFVPRLKSVENGGRRALGELRLARPARWGTRMAAELLDCPPRNDSRRAQRPARSPGSGCPDCPWHPGVPAAAKKKTGFIRKRFGRVNKRAQNLTPAASIAPSANS